MRRSVAEGIVDIEMFGEPLAHIFVCKFALQVYGTYLCGSDKICLECGVVVADIAFCNDIT